MAPIPITLLTGFLGSGKTTLLLNLLPQLRAQNPLYKLALLKNEFGDLAVDSQLAGNGAISGVRELLNGCICCNLVGELDVALGELKEQIRPDRIVIETSGSAFPATLAMEINRLARETNAYTLDGVITVIDVENWKGYEDTSYTAKIQARYTDLIVFNKWELAGERRMDECLDRLGDLEGVTVAWMKSDRGRVGIDVVFGVDGGLARALGDDSHLNGQVNGHDHSHEQTNSHTHDHGRERSHQSEVEVLSIALSSPASPSPLVDSSKLERLLKTAPKDEVYRIKALCSLSSPIVSSEEGNVEESSSGRYILNWAFGRWTCTKMDGGVREHESSNGVVVRMMMILARYESKKWKKRLEAGGFLELVGEQKGTLNVEKIA